MKRILIVIPDLKSGGGERSLVNFLNECEKGRYQIDLLLFRNEGIFMNQIPSWVSVVNPDRMTQELFAKNKSTSVHVKLLKYFGSFIGRFVAFSNWDKGKQIRWKYIYRHFIPRLKMKYDVAIAYLEGESTYYVADKVVAEKKICWFHNDYNKLQFSNRYDEPVFTQMSWIVTISDECINSLCSAFPGMKSKITKLENITSEQFVNNQANEKIIEDFWHVSNFPILLSIGRLDTQKGFDLAIRASALLKKRGFSFQWYIIGEGPQKMELIDLTYKLKVQNFIIFIGIRENPYPYMKLCDIFVQPSRFEGKSIVLDEAKILSKPIVVTNYSTVHDQIEDNKEGMIVDMNSEAIAEGIIQMYMDTKKRASIIEYLSVHKYGNRQEIEKYYQLID